MSRGPKIINLDHQTCQRSVTMTAEELIRTLANMTTPRDGITDTDKQDEAVADYSGDAAFDDAEALWSAIEEARKIVKAEFPNIPHASGVEKRIVGRLVVDLLAAGFNITIDDGGGIAESPLKRSTDADAIFAALSSTDSDRLYVDAAHRGGYSGWVYLVWGNDDCVISDYTTNLEQHLAAANKLAEELEA